MFTYVYVDLRCHVSMHFSSMDTWAHPLPAGQKMQPPEAVHPQCQYVTQVQNVVPLLALNCCRLRVGNRLRYLASAPSCVNVNAQMASQPDMTIQYNL